MASVAIQRFPLSLETAAEKSPQRPTRLTRNGMYPLKPSSGANPGSETTIGPAPFTASRVAYAALGKKFSPAIEKEIGALPPAVTPTAGKSTLFCMGDWIET